MIPMIFIEISLDGHDACYSYGHDANIYGDEFAIVPYVKREIIAIAPILDSPLNQKHDCNDFTIDSVNVNCANNMQNPKLWDVSFAMSTTCCNDHEWGDSSYDLENLSNPMMNMRLIILFAIILKVGLEECQFRSHIFGECSIL